MKMLTFHCSSHGFLSIRPCASLLLGCSMWVLKGDQALTFLPPSHFSYCLRSGPAAFFSRASAKQAAKLNSRQNPGNSCGPRHTALCRSSWTYPSWVIFPGWNSRCVLLKRRFFVDQNHRGRRSTLSKLHEGWTSRHIHHCHKSKKQNLGSTQVAQYVVHS